MKFPSMQCSLKAQNDSVIWWCMNISSHYKIKGLDLFDYSCALKTKLSVKIKSLEANKTLSKYMIYKTISTSSSFSDRV